MIIVDACSQGGSQQMSQKPQSNAVVFAPSLLSSSQQRPNRTHHRTTHTSSTTAITARVSEDNTFIGRRRSRSYISRRSSSLASLLALNLLSSTLLLSSCRRKKCSWWISLYALRFASLCAIIHIYCCGHHHRSHVAWHILCTYINVCVSVCVCIYAIHKYICEPGVTHSLTMTKTQNQTEIRHLAFRTPYTYTVRVPRCQFRIEIVVRFVNHIYINRWECGVWMCVCMLFHHHRID